MTFKIQGQSHSSKSHIWYNILSTHIPFVLCWSALQYLRYSYLKNWPWKSNFKVMGEVKVKSHNVSLTSYRLTSLSFHVNRPSHSWDTAISKFDVENSRSRSWVRSKLKVTTWAYIQSTHIPFVPCHSGIPFLSYDFLKIWPWKSTVNVIGEITVQSHNVDLTSYWPTSLSVHVNWASDSWVTTFSNLTLKIKGQGHGWGHSSKSQCGSNILSAHIPFIPCQSGMRFLSYDFFKIWP